MKKTTFVAVAVASVLTSAAASAATFTNGGFETGTLAGWTGGGGTWNNAVALPPPVNPALYNGGPATNTIMTGGVDPITGASRVYAGANSVRVNDAVNNYSVSTLRQTVTNYTDTDIFFAWNAVLEASHGTGDSDYFSLTLVDNTTNTTLVSRAYSSAGAIGAGTTGVTWTQFGSWFTSGWTVESIDLAALGAVGHNFTLTLLASDCPYGGHAGYVYLDGFGAVRPPAGVPEPASLALLGVGLAGLGFARRKKSA